MVRHTAALLRPSQQSLRTRQNHANNYTDRHARRRPFSNWMKRLANLKSSNAESGATGVSQKRNNIPMTNKSKKSSISRNNPYPPPGKPDPYVAGYLSLSAPLSSQRSRHSSL